jgi:hypothetical protein
MKKFLDDDFYNPNYNKHHIKNYHMLVCGGTGTGKSNFVSNLLMQMDNTFGKLIIVCKQKDEPIYSMLKNTLKDNCDVLDIKDLPDLNTLAKSLGGKQILMIFDDFIFCSQERLEDYVIRARKFKIMCVFLTQSFFSTSKIIRQNVGYIVLLTMSNQRNLNTIIETVGCSLSKDCIKKVIANATNFKMNVCIIDVYNPELNEKFRRNFTEFYAVSDNDGTELNPNMYTTSGVLN